MSKAAELAALIGSQTALSNRNLIINGAMQVSQRGTSQTGVTGAGYKKAPDRFNLNIISAGTWTASQSTTAPEGFANSYKLECTAASTPLASTGVMRFRYRMEGQNLQNLKKGTSNAESVTLSFYVRSSKTGTYTVELNDGDNSRHIVKSYNITSADTWQFVSLTYAGDTTGALDNDNNLSLSVMFVMAAGSNFTSGTLATSWAGITTANRSVGQVNLADTVGNTFYLTGVQLEIGEVATPFEHEDFGTTLAKCQRYFQKSYNHDTALGSTGVNGYFQWRRDGGNRALIPMHTSMRDAPTATAFNQSTGTSGQYRDASTSTNRTAGSFGVLGENAVSFDCGASGWGDLSTGNVGFMHFTLDAEL